MSDVHGALAILATVAAAAFVLVAILTAIGTTPSRLWLDRAILAQAATAILAAGVGALVAIGRPPSDPLHLLYGALIVAGPIGARYVVRGQATRRLGRSMAIVGVVLAGIVIRAFMTGG